MDAFNHPAALVPGGYTKILIDFLLVQEEPSWALTLDVPPGDEECVTVHVGRDEYYLDNFVRQIVVDRPLPVGLLNVEAYSSARSRSREIVLTLGGAPVVFPVRLKFTEESDG